MSDMGDIEFNGLLDSMVNNSINRDSKFLSDCEQLLDYYHSELFGDEEEGMSQVVTTDVADIVDSDMPSLVRVFLGAGSVVRFLPNSSNPEQIKEAEDKTKYADYLVRSKPGNYQILHNWMKNAEMQPISVLRYGMEEVTTTKEVVYENVDQLEIDEILKLLEEEDERVEKVEVVEHDEDDQNNFNLRFRVTRTDSEFKMVNIPIENFICTKGAESKEDAEVIGDEELKTRGQLLSEGFDRDLIDSLPTATGDSGDETANASAVERIRLKNQGGQPAKESAKDWASQEVLIQTLCAKIDRDGDGIPERRLIIRAGSEIISDEPFDHVNYAILTCDLMPHSIVGRSRAELALTDQRVKSVVLRNTLNNLYAVNHPRTVGNENVVLDDLLTMAFGSHVRVMGEVAPQSSLMNMEVPYIGDKSLQIIQYLDSAKSQRAGSLQASQGLDADQLYRETATRFEGIEKQQKSKIELVARNFAETGWRDLYEGAVWFAHHYQDTDQEINILGRDMKVKPSDWKFNTFAISEVGLGIDDGENAVQNMSAVYNLQQQLKSLGSLMVDDKKIYNTLDKMMKALGHPRTDVHFNDPTIPDQALKAQNEQLTQALQQAQQIIEELGKGQSLAEAEKIRAQASLIEAQNKDTLQAAKLASDRQVKELEMQQRNKEHEDKLVFDYTKLELEQDEDIPGQGL